MNDAMNTDKAKTLKNAAMNKTVIDKTAMDKTAADEKSAAEIGSESGEQQVGDSQLVDSQLVDAICLQLDQSCAALDGHTLSRLHQIRSTALASRHQGYRRYLGGWGSLVAACLVVAIGTTWLNYGVGDVTPSVEDVELLAANDAIDLYQDYEFYQWLASNE
jgi:hypothetical protein